MSDIQAVSASQSQTPSSTNGDQLTGENIVYFDGACPLCSAEIGHYQSCDGADGLRFVDVSREEVNLGEDLHAEAARKRFHLRRADGSLVSGARAFVTIWETLPGWRWAARIANLPGVIPVLEVGYRLFLPVRPALSAIARLFGAKALNTDQHAQN